ncbi:MAG: mechanosensitive ion channel family protein [Alphaproteobacteria bacterium]|nr:mechanosensitive ion channel family protein [Alphaproteobacteria bacterium]
MEAGVTEGVVDNAVEAVQAVPEKIQASAETLKNMVSSLTGMAVDFGIKLLAAIVVLVGGMWVAKRIARSFKRMLQRRGAEASLVSFLGSFVNILLRVFVVIISLATVGVQMTSIVAVLGAASLAVGMALSGTMQNFAGGIIIMFLKPFNVGDVIVTADGTMGIVKKIMIFTTEVHTFDNQVVLLPNGALSNSQITNLSVNNTRRMDFTVAISYGDNVDAARKEILAILKADKRILKDPAPMVFVSDLADSAVVLGVRYWTSAENYLPSRGDMLEAIYNKLPKKKIHFPFPQMDVHVKK